MRPARAARAARAARGQAAKLAGALAAVLALCAAAADAAKTPNIVLYLADDVGSGSVLQHAPEWSFVDDPSALEAIPEARRIYTPTLERMAREGKRFLRAFSSSPICSPSRHSLLTGITAGRQYVRGNGYGPESADVDIESGRTTVAKVLSAQGYATYAVGKWGVATSETSSGSPCRQGFDKFFGKFTHKSLGQAFPRSIETCTSSDPDAPESITYTENENASEELCAGTGTCTYFDFAVRDQALAFLDEAAESESPFFLYWATTAGHSTNWEYVTNRLGKKNCERKTHPVPAYGRYTESNLEGTGRVTPEIRGLMSMIELTVDEDLRLLLAKLKEHGQENSTLVVFTSDHGAHQEAYADADYDPHTDFYGTGGLRGIKRRLLEGGTRVPLLAWWPGSVPAGTTSSYPVALYDLPLTFAAVAGVDPAAAALDALGVEGGGMSFEALLRSVDDEASGLDATSRDYVYTEVCFVEDGKERPDDQVCPVTWNRYAGCGYGLYDLSLWPKKVLKLVQNKPREGNPELYEIMSDPFEQNDLAEARPAQVRRLAAMVAQARTPSCLAESAYEPRCLDDPCNFYTNATACAAQDSFLCEWESGICQGYTLAPTRTPTRDPTPEPTPFPTSKPTSIPTPTPTLEPTSFPTTPRPTARPSAAPIGPRDSTERPTMNPTRVTSTTSAPTLTQAPTLTPTTLAPSQVDDAQSGGGGENVAGAGGEDDGSPSAASPRAQWSLWAALGVGGISLAFL